MHNPHLYHASNAFYDWPNEDEWRKRVNADITGNRVLGLFCNTHHQGLSVYGQYLYRFNLKTGARVLEVDDDMRQAGRCQAYYNGIRDVLLHLGFAAVKVSHAGGAGYTVLDFSAIENWEYIRPAN